MPLNPIEQIAKVRAFLKIELYRQPTDLEIALELGVSEEAIMRCMQNAKAPNYPTDPMPLKVSSN